VSISIDARSFKKCEVTHTGGGGKTGAILMFLSLFCGAINCKELCVRVVWDDGVCGGVWEFLLLFLLLLCGLMLQQ
jgi:hypothetical protein